METLVPRRWPEVPAEKLSCTTQPSRTRLMELVPWLICPSFAPGHVRSHSPTQKSSCFCWAVVKGSGGAAFWAASLQMDSDSNTKMEKSFFMGILATIMVRMATNHSGLGCVHGKLE